MSSNKLPAPITGYTTTDAARVLGVATRTMRKIIADGRAASVRIPLGRIVPVDEMERLLVEGHRLRNIDPGPRAHGPDGRFKGSSP